MYKQQATFPATIMRTKRKLMITPIRLLIVSGQGRSVLILFSLPGSQSKYLFSNYTDLGYTYINHKSIFLCTHKPSNFKKYLSAFHFCQMYTLAIFLLFPKYTLAIIYHRISPTTKLVNVFSNYTS